MKWKQTQRYGELEVTRGIGWWEEQDRCRGLGERNYYV